MCKGSVKLAVFTSPLYFVYIVDQVKPQEIAKKIKESKNLMCRRALPGPSRGRSRAHSFDHASWPGPSLGDDSLSFGAPGKMVSAGHAASRREVVVQQLRRHEAAVCRSGGHEPKLMQKLSGLHRILFQPKTVYLMIR